MDQKNARTASVVGTKRSLDALETVLEGSKAESSDEELTLLDLGQVERGAVQHVVADLGVGEIEGSLLVHGGKQSSGDVDVVQEGLDLLALEAGVHLRVEGLLGQHLHDGLIALRRGGGHEEGHKK